MVGLAVQREGGHGSSMMEEGGDELAVEMMLAVEGLQKPVELV